MLSIELGPSDDEEEEGGGHLLKRQQRSTFASRSKDKVIRSLHLTSCSTDVSFEGSLSVGSSTDGGGGEGGGESGQGSFQLISRENSADIDEVGEDLAAVASSSSILTKCNNKEDREAIQ